MAHEHDFITKVVWTGDRGEGTRRYKGYDRTWSIETPGKPVVHCSNDPMLGGDPGLHNPEDLLVSAVSACHMLWYLHLASNAGIVVHGYSDEPVGTCESEPDGTGRFVKLTLRPTITLAPGSDAAKADAIHAEIHRHCFIARSVNFPVEWEATYLEG